MSFARNQEKDSTVNLGAFYHKFALKMAEVGNELKLHPNSSRRLLAQIIIKDLARDPAKAFFYFQKAADYCKGLPLTVFNVQHLIDAFDEKPSVTQKIIVIDNAAWEPFDFDEALLYVFPQLVVLQSNEYLKLNPILPALATRTMPSVAPVTYLSPPLSAVQPLQAQKQNSNPTLFRQNLKQSKAALPIPSLLLETIKEDYYPKSI